MTNYIKSGVLVMLLITIGKIIAFFKDILIANYFGTSLETDSFFIAFNISSIFFIAFFSTVNLVFLPQYNYSIKKYGKKSTNVFVSNIFNIYILITVLLIVCLIIYAPELVRLIDSSNNLEKHKLTVILLRIMSLSFIFSIAISFFNSIQLSNEKFIYPQLVTIINNFVVVIFIILFANRFGIISVAIGGVVSWIIQFPLHLYLVKNYFKYLFIINLKEKRVKEMFIVFLPAFLGVMVDQMNILVDTVLASGLDEGSISSLNYANRLTLVFNGIFTLAVISIVYPLFSKYIASDDYKNLKKSLSKSIKLLIIVLLPITTVIIIYYYEIIKVIFKRGEFNESSVEITSGVFLFYSIAILFWGLRELLNKVFYAQKNTKTPLFLSFITVSINIIFSLILVECFSVKGLALATSISIFICVVIQVFILKDLIFNKFSINFNKFLIKMIIIIFIFYFLMYSFKDIYLIKNAFFNLSFKIIFGLFFYFLLLNLFKIEEVKFIREKFRKVNT